MKYIEYPNRAAAFARSAVEMKKSPGYRSENVTQYRWSIVVNEDTGTATLAIPVSEISRLTATEASRAVTKTELEAKDPGWFKTERAERN